VKDKVADKVILAHRKFILIREIMRKESLKTW
jgi:hypothetical protein